MAVAPIKNTNTVAITNMHEAREDKQREQENKKPSKNKKSTGDAQARQEAATRESEPENNLEIQINSQPVDTEKVIELLAQKKSPPATKAQILELSTKRAKKQSQKKIDKIY